MHASPQSCAVPPAAVASLLWVALTGCAGGLGAAQAVAAEEIQCPSALRTTQAPTEEPGNALVSVAAGPVQPAAVCGGVCRPLASGAIVAAGRDAGQPRSAASDLALEGPSLRAGDVVGVHLSEHPGQARTPSARGGHRVPASQQYRSQTGGQAAGTPVQVSAELQHEDGSRAGRAGDEQDLSQSPVPFPVTLSVTCRCVVSSSIHAKQAPGR